MNEETIELCLEALIYQIRGERVLLDRDLAQLYGVETKALIQAVNRNPGRFPSDFMFQLSNQEFENWRSQIVTSNSGIKMGLRRPPYAFTEQGVAMLSSVLRSPQAIEVNVEIMRTFVRLRRIIESHLELSDKLFELEQRHEQKFQVVFEAINKLVQDKAVRKKNRIGFGKG